MCFLEKVKEVLIFLNLCSLQLEGWGEKEQDWESFIHDRSQFFGLEQETALAFAKESQFSFSLLGISDQQQASASKPEQLKLLDPD